MAWVCGTMYAESHDYRNYATKKRAAIMRLLRTVKQRQQRRQELGAPVPEMRTLFLTGADAARLSALLQFPHGLLHTAPSLQPVRAYGVARVGD